MRTLARLVVVLFTAAALTYATAANTATAGPIAPDILFEVTPTTLRPATGGYVYVGGRQPLEVTATLGGEPLEMFWAGHGYMGVFAFGFEQPPGPLPLEVNATDPLTGEVLTFSETIQVSDFSYPLEQLALPFRLLPLLDPDLNERENAIIAEALAQHTTPASFDWPFATPVPFGIVTSRFGGDRLYNAGLWQQYHTGADFRRTVGDPIYSTADGRVSAILPMEIYGNVLIIDHGYGVFSLYAHCSEFYVEEGDRVQKGQLVAAAGASGRTNGPHLHWEIIVDGVPVDPMAWLALDPEYVPLREANPGE